MSEPHMNPRYVFPAPGWRCFQCNVCEDGTIEFWEQPVVGWGVVEGFDCAEGCEDGSVLELLVALQDGPIEGPMVLHDSELHDLHVNAAFGFCFKSDLDDEQKKILETKARENLSRRTKKVA